MNRFDMISGMDEDELDSLNYKKHKKKPAE
jgi:hypothetical protein